MGSLTSNALKFTTANGAIHLTIKRLDRFITIEVKDNGTGIEPED